MSDLPLDWQLVPLDELRADEPGAITDGPFGSKLTSAHYAADGARVVRLQNIGDGVFKEADAFIPFDHYETLRRHEVHAGDLLVASLGDNPPRACLAPEGLGPAIVKADCIRVRLAADVDSRWVLYSMQSSGVRRWAAEQMHGVGRLRLGLRSIKAIPIPIPPLTEQRRIVELLDDHLSRLNAAAASLAKARFRVGAWHRSTLDRLIWSSTAPRRAVHGLLSAPMRNGHSARASQPGEVGVRTLTLTAVTRKEFSDRFTKMAAVDEGRAAGLWLKSGDILVQRSNTPELVGTSALYEGPDGWAIFPDLMIRLRTDDEFVSPQFLAAALESERAHRSLRDRAKGLAGSMPKIDQATIASTEVPVPSHEEQSEILAALNAHEDVRRRMDRAVADQLQRQTGLRRALLDAAFSGRLTGRTSDLDQVEELAEANA